MIAKAENRIVLLGILLVTVLSTRANSPVLLRNSLDKTTFSRLPRSIQEECSSNETVTSQGGSITSPGYPEKYPSNSDCRWLLSSSDGSSNIVLRIKSLNLEKGTECELDYLQIHFGPSTLSPSLERMCGALLDKVIVTNSSTVLLIFHSDPSYNDKGFSIDYYLQSLAGCPTALTSPSGSISSPNFPENYPDDTDCWTVISVETEKQILFQFDSLDLEFDENCTYDYIQIFDGSSRDSAKLGRFCSTNQKFPVKSTTNQLLVHFHSDHLVNKKGFQAQYSSILSHNGMNFTDLGGCLWESEEKNGTIASPNYPQKYPSDANCKIFLKAPENKTITIVFDNLQLEVESNCSYDYLDIRDGYEADQQETLKFCGRLTEEDRFTSKTNALFITFQSDDFAEFSGFKARYWFHGITNESEADEFGPEEHTSEEVETGEFFLTKPENITLPVGSSFMMPCSVRDSTATIHWLKDDRFLRGTTPIPGLKLMSNNTLSIPLFDKHHAGVYTCAAITSGETHYAKAWIKIENHSDFMDTPTCSIVLRKKPRDSAFTEGEFAHMECLAAGNQIQVHWEKDGKLLQTKDHITVLRNGFLFIDKVTLDDAGIYTCITSDQNCQETISAALTVNEKSKLNEICGLPKANQPSSTMPRLDHGKIVGGHNTKKGAYPWQVMLWEPHLKAFCGGSLLNERWIISAAHCFTTIKGLRWDDVVVKLGKHNREEEEGEEIETVIADSSAIIIHPAYNKNNFDNDIALIRLRDHIKFTDHILPVCLGDSDVFEDNTQLRIGTVTGWGKLKENGASPKYLQEIQMPIVSQKTCTQSTNFTVTRNMFCAGYAQEILGDSCQGDSGGPFLFKDKNRWYLIGIVSWGEGCGKANKYGYYTKITNYLPWIRGIMKS